MATRVDLKKLRDEILAEQLEDMKPAEEAAASASSRAGWGRVASGLAGALGGYKQDNSFWDNMENRGRQGLVDAKVKSGLKQAAMGEARAIADSQNAAAKDAEENDANSDQSKANAELAGRLTGNPDLFKGMSTKQMKEAAPFLKEYFEKEQAKRSATRRAEERKDDRTYQEGRDEKLHGYRLKEAEVTAGIKAAAPEKQPTVPAGEASQVGELSAATKMADDLWKEWEAKASSPGSGLMSKLPGTDAAQYTDAQRAGAQTIGTILEGGKLTDADLAKYMALVPTASDSRERAQAKVDRLKRMIDEKKNAKVTGLGQAGYKVGGFDAPTPDAPAPAGVLTPAQKTRLEELRRKRVGQ